MSTAAVPPTPQSPTPQSPAPNEPGRRSAPRVIALLTAALGVAVVVGTVTSAVVPTFAAASSRTETTSLAVGGVTALDLDIEATSFSVRFGSSDEATLDLQGVRGGAWDLERDGSTLRVESPRQFFGDWFRGGGGTATLTLPRSLESRGLDADVSFAGGGLSVEGAFDRLAIDLGGGRLTAAGNAKELMVEVGAGDAKLDVEGVTTADLSIAAGRMRAEIGGDAPDEVAVSVSAGTMEVTLPDAEYSVTESVDAGDFENGLRTATGSPHAVSVDVSAGSARLSSD